MPRYDVLTLRTGILSALTAATPLAGWRIKTYRGEIEQYFDGIGDVVGDGNKIIYLKMISGPNEPQSQCSYAKTINFDLIAISNKASGQDKRCEEVEGIINAVEDAIAGKRLSIQIKPIESLGWKYILQDHNSTALEMNFETLFDYNVTIER